jgi:hypothetical protein
MVSIWVCGLRLQESAIKTFSFFKLAFFVRRYTLLKRLLDIQFHLTPLNAISMIDLAIF